MTRHLLGLESGGDRVSVALLRWPEAGEVEVLVERSEPAERDQGRRLMPMIAEVCGGAGVAASDLAAVAVARGPGSYTGLRVGIATALGLGAAGGPRVLGVESLRAAAFAAGRAGSGLSVAILPAGRGGLYAQAFAWPADAAVPEAAGEAVRTDAEGAIALAAEASREGPPAAVVSVGEAAATAVANVPGGAKSMLSFLPAGAVGRLAAVLAREGVRRHGQALAVAPIYLRPAAAATGA